jgi:ABC-type transport system involved in multi-copper enzyme maturation permease subunit
MLQRGRTAYQKASGTFLRSGIFILLLGAVFLTIGIISSIGSQPNYFLIVTGLLFVGWGISQFLTVRRYRQK